MTIRFFTNVYQFSPKFVRKSGALSNRYVISMQLTFTSQLYKIIINEVRIVYRHKTSSLTNYVYYYY